MSNMKMGSIVQILREDNVILVREENSLTDFIVFIDTLSGQLRRRVSVGMRVSFTPAEFGYQFVGHNMKPVKQLVVRVAA